MMKNLMRILFVIGLMAFLANNASAKWVQTNGPFGGNIKTLAVNDGKIFAGTNSNGVFLSTDNGSNWTAINSGLTNAEVRVLATSGDNVFAGTVNGLFRSNDTGAGWVAVDSGFPDIEVMSLATDDNKIFAGTAGSGIFLSTDNGTSWTAVNSGLTDTYVRSLAVHNGYLFAGTLNSSVWRIPLSEITGTILGQSRRHSNRLHLDNVSPGTSRSGITVEFSIPHSDMVSMTLFDSAGRRVATLVKKPFNAGK